MSNISDGEVIDLDALLMGNEVEEENTTQPPVLEEDLKSEENSEEPIEEESNSKYKVEDTEEIKQEEESNEDSVEVSAEDDTTQSNNKDIILDLVEKGVIPTIENIDDIDFNSDFSELLSQVVKEVVDTKVKDSIEKEQSSIPEILNNAISLAKNKGDFLEVLQEYKDVVNPVENLDLDSEKGQAESLFHYYATFYPNLSNDEIIDFIKLKKDKGELEEYSRTAVTKINTHFKEKVDNKIKEAQIAEKERVEVIKSQKTAVRKVLKDTYNLSDTLTKKYLDFGFREDNEGKFEMDKKYEEVSLNNPEIAAKLLILLQDPEGLDKIIKSKLDSEVMKTQAKGFKFAKSSKANSGIPIDPEKESKNTNRVEDLSDLFK